jgi:tetratricopeptide (TPR) repeat protein
LTALASIHLRLGNTALGIHTANAAVELSARAGAGVACRALVEKGHAYWESQDYAQARQAYLRARDHAEEAEDHHHLIHCEGNIGSCLAKLGRWKHAESQVRKAVELARSHGRPEKEALWLVELGRILYSRKKHDEAYDLADLALRMAQRHEHWGIAFRAVMIQHRVVRLRNPEEPDRHRIHYLKKLYSWMEEHTVDEDVTEFLREIGDALSVEEEGES